jgi:tripartite-type tricarboxylate transporter receptor subunit TctC
VIARPTTLILLIVGAAFGLSQRSARAEAVADFYNGKTINLLIGDATGGANDAYARLIGRYLGKYLPGNPAVVAQNMPGAGSFRAAQRVTVSAPQDGTYIGLVHSSILLDSVIDDPRRKTEQLEFGYLGSANKNLAACFVRADAPVKRFADLFHTEMIAGAGNDASTTREYSALLNSVLGTKLKVTSGYTGNAHIFLAIDRGEVQGSCGASYVAVAALRQTWLAQKLVNPIVQESLQGHPHLNKLGVPLVFDFVKTDEQRKILEVFYSQQEYGRPFVTGPKVPRERLVALQTAFMNTINDRDLQRDADKAGLELMPVSGPEVAKLVADARSSPSELFRKIRQALGHGG